MTDQTMVVTRERSLGARPIPNPRLGVETGEDGAVILVVPPQFVKRRLLTRLMFPSSKQRERRMELDPVGSYVWGMCDGGHSVREIIATLADRFKFARREAEVSVLKYLADLGRSGFIGMEMAREDD